MHERRVKHSSSRTLAVIKFKILASISYTVTGYYAIVPSYSSIRMSYLNSKGLVCGVDCAKLFTSTHDIEQYAHVGVAIQRKSSKMCRVHNYIQVVGTSKLPTRLVMHTFLLSVESFRCRQEIPVQVCCNWTVELFMLFGNHCTTFQTRSKVDATINVCMHATQLRAPAATNNQGYLQHPQPCYEHELLTIVIARLKEMSLIACGSVDDPDLKRRM
jgi:hypothetical protein